jgi:endonuclease YncB( thermonuclease family)
MTKFTLTLTLLFSFTLSQAEVKTLRYVIDGDTVVFNGGTTCRLAHIDTPESKRNAKATRDVAKCDNVSIGDVVESGRYAKRYLKSVLRKGADYDIQILGQDRYKRDICVIFKDGISVNESLVRYGFAVPFWRYIKNPSIKKSMIKHIQFANSQNKGIWRTHRNVMECMN